MKIGIVSDSLGHLSFEELLDAAVELGVQGVEMNTGNWSSAPTSISQRWSRMPERGAGSWALSSGVGWNSSR